MRKGPRKRKFRLTTRLLTSTVLLFAALLPSHVSSKVFSSDAAGFSVKFRDEISSHSVLAIPVLPGESFTFEIVDSGGSDRYIVKPTTGMATQISARKWRWIAPGKKGLYPLDITSAGTGTSLTLNIFVMVPAREVCDNCMNSYRIGTYPPKPYKENKIYTPPDGFIEVTEENEDTPVSPHFTLKQFLCKQEGTYPKYVVFKERLLLKLELILEEVNRKGYAAETFNILSGYRTPHYNKSIGNVKNSCHIFGRAADIFIDEDPKDDMMDDLNRDGKIDFRDAALLYDIVDKLDGEPKHTIFRGGLSTYGNTASHGPFVHVDVRGYNVRWENRQ